MIKIVCVGKIKEKFYKEAILEYLKRLTKYIKVEIIEVNDVFMENEDLILKKEAELILKHINPKDYVICLDINGNEVNSIEFSKKIDNILINNSNLCFVIGGSYGIDESIKRNSYLLSFSKLTFPHQLFRVILLEQIYRSFRIINNEKYHK